MGSTNGNGEGKEKLPLAPDLDQIYNRISMGLNHHSLLARSLKKKPTTTTSTSSTTTSSTTTGQSRPEEMTKTGFFSPLANANTASFSSTKQLATSLNEQRRSEKTNTDRQADLDALFAEPPNAGLGYVPPSKSASGASTPSLTGDKEKDRKLRAQILGGGRGKRGRDDEQTSNNSSSRNLKRASKGHESDSDEDVGRSALGRSKKRVRTGTGVALESVAAAAASVVRKRENSQAQTQTKVEEVADNRNKNIGGEEAGEAAMVDEQSPPETVAAQREEKAETGIPKENTVAQGQASEAGEGGKEAGGDEEAKEKRKKKKKKSKNRNKKKRKTEEGTATPKEGVEQDQDQDDEDDEED